MTDLIQIIKWFKGLSNEDKILTKEILTPFLMGKNTIVNDPQKPISVSFVKQINKSVKKPTTKGKYEHVCQNCGKKFKNYFKQAKFCGTKCFGLSQAGKRRPLKNKKFSWEKPR